VKRDDSTRRGCLQSRFDAVFVNAQSEAVVRVRRDVGDTQLAHLFQSCASGEPHDGQPGRRVPTTAKGPPVLSIDRGSEESLELFGAELRSPGGFRAQPRNAQSTRNVRCKPSRIELGLKHGAHKANSFANGCRGTALVQQRVAEACDVRALEVSDCLSHPSVEQVGGRLELHHCAFGTPWREVTPVFESLEEAGALSR